MSRTEAAVFRSALPEQPYYPSGIIIGDSVEAPAQVAGVSASAGLRTILIEWDRLDGLYTVDGAGGYEVELDTVNTFDSVGLRSQRTSATLASFTDLTPDTLYYVRVRAVQGAENYGEWSATVSDTTALADTADITVGAITADRLSADAVTAAKLASITMEVGKYIQSSNYDGTDIATGDATQGWRIEDGAAEFNDGIFRGTVIGSEFKTAETGQRIEILPDGGGIGVPVIHFYSDNVNETFPGELYVDDQRVSLSGPVISGAFGQPSLVMPNDAAGEVYITGPTTLTGHDNTVQTLVVASYASGADQPAIGSAIIMEGHSDDTITWPGGYHHDWYWQVDPADDDTEAALSLNFQSDGYDALNALTSYNKLAILEIWPDGDVRVNDHSLVNPTRVRVERTTEMSDVANNTWSSVSFGTEVADVGGWWTSGADLTVPEDGIYVVGAQVYWQLNSTGIRGCRVTENVAGTHTPLSTVLEAATGSTAGNTMLLADELELTAGQVLNLQVFQNSGGVLDVRGQDLPIVLRLRRVV